MLFFWQEEYLDTKGETSNVHDEGGMALLHSSTWHVDIQIGIIMYLLSGLVEVQATHGHNN